MTPATARSEPTPLAPGESTSTIALPVLPRRVETGTPLEALERLSAINPPVKMVSSPPGINSSHNESATISGKPTSSPSPLTTATKLTPKSLSPSTSRGAGENTKDPSKSPPLVRVTSDKTFVCVSEPVSVPESSEKCQLCGWTFSCPLNKIEHMRRHRRRELECETQNRAFTDSYQLEVHMRSHYTDKPYKCALCNREFSRSGNLATHLRTHTHTKPFECGFCHKRFSQRVNMELHTRIHTGVRPYACGVCNRTFTSCSNMRRHWRQVHPSIPEPKLGTTQLKNGMPEKQFYSDPVLSKTFLRPQVLDANSTTLPSITPPTQSSSQPPLQLLSEKSADSLEGQPSLAPHQAWVTEPPNTNNTTVTNKKRNYKSSPIPEKEHGLNSTPSRGNNFDCETAEADRLNLSRARLAVHQHMSGPPSKKQQTLLSFKEEQEKGTPAFKRPNTTEQVIHDLTNPETYKYIPSEDGGTFGLLLGVTFTPVKLPQTTPSDWEESTSESGSEASETEGSLILSPPRPSKELKLDSVSPGSSNNQAPRPKKGTSSRPLYIDETNGSRVFVEFSSMPYQARLELRQREHAEEEKRKREKRDQMPARRSRILHRYAMLNAASNIYAETSTPVFGFAKIAHDADIKVASPSISPATPCQVPMAKKIQFAAPIVGPSTDSEPKESTISNLPRDVPTGLLLHDPPSVDPTELHFAGTNPTSFGPNISPSMGPSMDPSMGPNMGSSMGPNTPLANAMSSLPHPSLETATRSAKNVSFAEPSVAAGSAAPSVAYSTATPFVPEGYNMEHIAPPRVVSSNQNAWTLAMLANQSYPFSAAEAAPQTWLSLNSPYDQDVVSAQLQYLYAYNSQLALAQWAQLQAYQASMPSASLGSAMNALGYTQSPTVTPSTVHTPGFMMRNPNSAQIPMFSGPVNPPLPRTTVTIEDIITQGRASNSKIKSTGFTPTVPVTSDGGSGLPSSIPYQKRMVANPPSEVCKQELDELEGLNLEFQKSSSQDFNQTLPPISPTDEKAVNNDRTNLLAFPDWQKLGTKGQSLASQRANDEVYDTMAHHPRKPQREPSLQFPNLQKDLTVYTSKSSTVTAISPQVKSLSTNVPSVSNDRVRELSGASLIPPVVIPARLRDKSSNLAEPVRVSSILNTEIKDEIKD